MKNLIIVLTVVVIAHYLFFLFGFSFVDGTNANFYMDNNLTLEKKGVFGDFTSGHFSILAFIWLAYGIYIQSKEFQLQREEFQNQTEQFREQNKLYEQQMKELEIQSIQNQFDRKIAKLTEIEKNIANSKLANYDIYKFNIECNSGTGIEEKFSKLDSLLKYITLYKNLYDFISENENKITLKEELFILKKDIYDGVKLSFLKLLYHLTRDIYNRPITSEFIYVEKFSKLKIFHSFQKDLKNNIPFSTSRENLGNLDDIDIFEKVESS